MKSCFKSSILLLLIIIFVSLGFASTAEPSTVDYYLCLSRNRNRNSFIRRISGYSSESESDSDSESESNYEFSPLLKNETNKIPAANSSYCRTSTVKEEVPLFDILSTAADIFTHLTAFIINEESATLHLLSLVRQIPKLYHILFRLSSLKDFPLHLIDCFGYFSLQELLTLHQLAPELCHANRNKRLEAFLSSKRFLIPNYFDNFLIQILDKSKYFQQVLTNMETRTYSWETRTRFVQKYHTFCLIPQYEFHTNSTHVPCCLWTSSRGHYLFLLLITKYQPNPDFISRAFALQDSITDTRTYLFLTGLMLATTGHYDSVSTILQQVQRSDQNRPEEEYHHIFEGFLEANFGPISSKQSQEIKDRNIQLTTRFTFLQQKIFTLANLLKFGSPSDIDSIDPLNYKNLFSNRDLRNHSQYILLLVLVTVWRRPDLSEAWHRLYERFPVKNDFVTACFAPELLIDSSDLVNNVLVQSIMSAYPCLPPTLITRSFTDKFIKSLKSHILEHPDGRNDMLFYKSLKSIISLKFPDLIYDSQFLKRASPSLNSEFGGRFIDFIFAKDQNGLAIVRASFQYDHNNEAKCKFYSEFLKLRLIPAAYMQQFLMTWTGAIESDVQSVLSLSSLDNNDFENSAQEHLHKVIRSFYLESRDDFYSRTRKSWFVTTTILMDEILYADLWYFYLKYNETSFRKVCTSFESHFQPLPEPALKLY